MDKSLIDTLTQINPKFCAFASASQQGKPEAAFMAFAVMENGDLLLSTDIKSRKVTNLRNNPVLAVSIGMDTTQKNYQVEGKTTIIEEADPSFQQLKDLYYNQNPHLIGFRDLPDHVFIRVTPTWIRTNDYTVKPPHVTETNI